MAEGNGTGGCAPVPVRVRECVCGCGSVKQASQLPSGKFSGRLGKLWASISVCALNIFNSTLVFSENVPTKHLQTRTGTFPEALGCCRSVY